IEISFLRRLDDFGQFARTERTPPVDRGHSRFRSGRLARAIVIGRRNIQPRLRLVAGQQAAAEGQCQTQTLQHDPERAPPSLRSRLLAFPNPLHSKSLSKPGQRRLGGNDTTTVCRWRASVPAANWPRPVCPPVKFSKRSRQKCPESSGPTSTGPPGSSPSPRALPQRRTVPGVIRRECCPA